MRGLGRRLVQLLRLFWSWLVHVFSRRKKLPDIENHIEKGTHATQSIPSTSPVARPKRATAHFPKGIDTCQPPLPSEWANQKARFLRSPVLKRARKNNDKHQLQLHYVRFATSSQTSDPPAHTPTDPEHGGGGDPPTIRVEDWSSPIGSIHRSKSKSRSRSRSDKNRLSVNGYTQSRSPVNPVTKSSIPILEEDLLDSAVTSNTPNQIYLDPAKTINTIASQDLSPLSINVQSPARDIRQNLEISEAAERRIPNTAKLKLAHQPSRAPAITHGSYGDIVSKYRKSNKENENFDPSSLRRQKSEGSQHQRSPNRMLKAHNSRPHSAMPTSSFWDRIGFATKMNDREFMKGNLSLFVSSIPNSPGKSNRQATLQTKFFEIENTIDEIACMGIIRPKNPLLSRHSKHTTMQEEYGLAELPYPCVFSLDDYFEDSISSSSAGSELPRTVPLTLSSSSTDTSSNPEASSTSESDGPASFDTPTPAPRRASSLIMTSNRASFFGRRASTVKVMETMHNLVVDGNGDTPTITFEYPSPPCEFEEELTAHKILHLNDEDTTERRDDTGDDLDGDSADVRIGRLQGSICSGSSPLNSDYPHLSVIIKDVQIGSQVTAITADRGTSPIQNNDHFEMNRIRASLHSPSGYTYGLFKDKKHGKEGDDSQVSLMESFSSGSTLSHHHHYRHWKSRSFEPPPPLPGLPPGHCLPPVPSIVTSTIAVEDNSEEIEPNSGHNLGTIPATVSIRSPDADEANPEPLTWTSSMGLPLSMRKPEKVLIKEKDHYRGIAFTRTPEFIVKPPMSTQTGRSRSLGSGMVFSSIPCYPTSTSVPGVSREDFMGRRSHGAMPIKF